MNKILTCCLSGIALIVLSSCAKDYSKEISDLDSRINALEKANYATQLASLSSSIASLQSDVSSLKNSSNTVESNLSSINSTLSNIQSQINTLLTKDEFNIYKTANDKAVEDLIKGLNGKVSQSDYDSFKSKTYTDIAELITLLNGKVSQSDYNAFVANYYSMIDGVRIDIAGLKSSMVTKTELESYKSEVSEAQSTMQSSIDSLLSRVNGLEMSLGELSDKIIGIQTQINNLDSRIWALESKLSVIEGKISSFVERVQSIVYIPRYDDGASTMWYYTLSQDSFFARDTIDFRVSPADCADSLLKMWDKAISAEAVSVNTRGSQQAVALPVVSVTGGNGKISVVLDGSPLKEESFSGKQKIKAVVIISDGNNERTSDYISIVPREMKNVICYTSTDGKVVTPYKTDAFGSNIISNEYFDECGVIVFDGEVTEIGEHAFEACNRLYSIRLPDSVISIGDYSFFDCKDLSSITIPSAVTHIGEAAFSGCLGIRIFEIPSSVESIGREAFSDCSGLSYIICSATTPPEIDISFDTDSNYPIYVPSESVEAYMAAESWSRYADRIIANPIEKFTSNVTWALGSSAFEGIATVNGFDNIKVLKLGTSSKIGNAAVVVPKGTKSVSFYGVSWKGKPTSVQVLFGETPLYTQALAANEGASYNSPYTITVTDSDYYTMTLPETLTDDVTVTVTTTGSNTRVILFGIKAE